MRRLWRVEISTVVYVMAEDRGSAEEVAADALWGPWRPDRDAYEFSAGSEPVADLSTVEPEWRDSYPYGGDEDDRTLAEILAEARA